MKAIIYGTKNEKTGSTYYGLKVAETGKIIYACPPYRTIGGVCNWAFRNGYAIIDIITE